ncbi:MAG TPA: ester cyclase [Acidimicrobiia bacterium]|nr:ester cyclase [Acidimicrobiia bacterium]HZQ77544.1 ester cyclase [Acidimicrobiia bacterium]
MAAMYHDNGVRRETNTSTVSEGPKGMTAFAEMFFAAVPDAVCEARTWLQTGDTLAVEWTWSGR